MLEAHCANFTDNGVPKTQLGERFAKLGGARSMARYTAVFSIEYIILSCPSNNSSAKTQNAPKNTFRYIVRSPLEQYFETNQGAAGYSFGRDKPEMEACLLFSNPNCAWHFCATRCRLQSATRLPAAITGGNKALKDVSAKHESLSEPRSLITHHRKK